MLYGHGDDRYKYDQEIKADFSSNVWHGKWPAGLENVLKQSFSKINHYPEPNAESLKEALSKFHQLYPSRILPTNGGTEAFYLIGKTFEKRSATIPVPTFSEYEDDCRIHHINSNFIQRNELSDYKTVNSDLIFICNPNNPTGEVFSAETLENLISHNKDTFFIIDEAFIDFTFSTRSLENLIAQYQNLIIVKSLTKTFAIPGLRLGYIISNTHVIKEILKNKMPWSVNTLAIEAGKYIVDNYNKLKPDFRKDIQNRKSLWKEIEKLKYLKPINSETTFGLIKLEKGTAADLKKYLLENYQILVRDASNFTGLNDQYIRISIQNEDDNKYILKGLKSWSHTF